MRRDKSNKKETQTDSPVAKMTFEEKLDLYKGLSVTQHEELPLSDFKEFLRHSLIIVIINAVVFGIAGLIIVSLWKLSK